MEKVFTNVIGNAVAYSPVGAVIIVTQKDEVFSVENTGVHIAEEDLERIFTPRGPGRAGETSPPTKHKGREGGGVGDFVVKGDKLISVQQV